MSKVINKKSAFLWAIILIISVVFSACASTPASSTEPSAAPSAAAAVDGSPSVTTSYDLGANVWVAGVPICDAFLDAIVYTGSVFGCKVETASDDATAEKELANIQNFCAAGKDGIVMMAAAIATVPQMAQVCQDAKVPFVMYTQIGNDSDRDKIAANNDYYVGAVDADMVAEGAAIAQIAFDNGCKTAVLIGGNVGDSNHDQRSQGFREKFEGLGGMVLSEARCTDPSEAATKAEDMLSANKDADCLYAMDSGYTSGSLSAIDNLGLDTDVYMSCVAPDSAQYLQTGEVVAASDGIVYASYIAPTLLINYLDGHPIKDENGLGPRLRTTPFIVTGDNIDAYISVFCTDGIEPVTDDVLKSLTWRYNPDVTYQTYVDLLESGLTLNAVLEAHGLATVD
jgi:ABC-type sugar transport system substrate-binding protein